MFVSNDTFDCWYDDDPYNRAVSLQTRPLHRTPVQFHAGPLLSSVSHDVSYMTGTYQADHSNEKELRSDPLPIMYGHFLRHFAHGLVGCGAVPSKPALAPSARPPAANGCQNFELSCELSITIRSVSAVQYCGWLLYQCKMSSGML